MNSPHKGRDRRVHACALSRAAKRQIERLKVLHTNNAITLCTPCTSRGKECAAVRSLRTASKPKSAKWKQTIKKTDPPVGPACIIFTHASHRVSVACVRVPLFYLLSLSHRRPTHTNTYTHTNETKRSTRSVSLQHKSHSPRVN